LARILSYFVIKIKPGQGIHKITIEGCREDVKYSILLAAIPKGDARKHTLISIKYNSINNHFKMKVYH
jgi:hypothetical protein